MDAKITELDANTTPASTDLTVIVDDPGSTPATQKMTLDTLDDYFSATTKTLTNKTLTAPKIDDIVAATVDHITLTPGASKLVKVAVLRQNDTTNAYNNNSVILTGWGFILGDTTSQMTEAITFGVTFSSAPLIVANGFGSKTGSDPSVIANLTDAANHHAAPEVPSTTGFNIRLSRISADGDAVTGFGNTVRYAYAWIAIGQLT